MEFDWTTEQNDLREGVRRVLASKAPLARARQIAEAGTRVDRQLWDQLAQQVGVHGLMIPVEHGGSGATAVELAIVMDEMGRVLHGGPFLSTVVFAAQALVASGDAALCSDLLPRIAEGGLSATLAVVEADSKWSAESIATWAAGTAENPRLHGVKELVLDGADAEVILVAAKSEAGMSLYLVEADAPGLDKQRLNTLDLTRPMARITFNDVPARLVGSEGDGWAVVETVKRAAAVQLAAEQVGASAALVQITADYAKTRRQFGRPIGSFQGVKHRLADMAVRLEMSRSAAYWAAWQDPGSSDHDLGVAVARSYCSESFVQTAKDAIQLHGGIGFTWEHDAHLFLRRARLDASLVGPSAEYRAALLPHVMTRTEASA